MQTTTQVAGQGVRTQGISQQFTQGTIETTDKTLDLAITGEGFFTVKRSADDQIGYTRNGAFSVEEDRYVVDTTGARLQEIGRACVGKEWVSTCRSRWARYHSKKKQN